jgi:hypothetical protein
LTHAHIRTFAGFDAFFFHGGAPKALDFDGLRGHWYGNPFKVSMREKLMQNML